MRPSLRLLSLLAFFLLPSSFCLASDHTGTAEDVRDTSTGNHAAIKLHDNGDGTYSPVVNVGSVTVTGAGDASAANQTSQLTQETATNTVLGTKADDKSTATNTTQVSIVSLLKEISAMVQAPPSQAVTNAGTFATQSTTAQKQYTGTPSNFTIGTSDATVFTLAAGEIGFIQNLDDAALAVKKGASASTSSFSFILAAGTAAADGKGGAIKIDDWVGAVSVAAMTGTASYIAWKQAP